MKKALFLDRDGVINKEKDYVYRIQDFEFIDGIFDTLKKFQDDDFLLIVITNQSGIGRGYYSEKQFLELNQWMINEFAKKDIIITKTYYSPYHPIHGIGRYKKHSDCRKPGTGMIMKAKDEYNIELSKSILVGDKSSDIKAGIDSGIGLNIQIKSGKDTDECLEADMIVDTIKELYSRLFEQ